MSDSGITGPFDELRALENRLEKLGPAKIATAAARAIGAVAKRQYKAGRGPDGTPWPAKKDGSKPLANAATEVQFVAQGNSIVGSAPWHYRFHAEKCPVFPAENAALPPAWAKAIEDAAQAVIEGKGK